MSQSLGGERLQRAAREPPSISLPSIPDALDQDFAADELRAGPDFAAGEFPEGEPARGTFDSDRQASPLNAAAFAQFGAGSSRRGAADDSMPDAGAERLTDSLAGHGTRLDQVSRELDSTLARLFTAQLETFEQLRQRLDDHERRWLEQQAVRRGLG